MAAAGGATYHKLVLGELVGDLGHGDGARNLVVVRGSRAWRARILARADGLHWDRGTGAARGSSDCILWQYVPVNSRVNLTSKMVMTLPLRCATSTSPSMPTTLVILAVTSPSFASTLVRWSSNHCRAHGEASLLTQCQLLGLCRTMVAAGLVGSMSRARDQEPRVNLGRSATGASKPRLETKARKGLVLDQRWPGGPQRLSSREGSTSRPMTGAS